MTDARRRHMPSKERYRVGDKVNVWYMGRERVGEITQLDSRRQWPNRKRLNHKVVLTDGPPDHWLGYFEDEMTRVASSSSVGRAEDTEYEDEMSAEDAARVEASFDAPTDPALCDCGHEGLGTGWHSNTCRAHNEAARIPAAGRAEDTEPEEAANG
jgi:hypothetical protein